jgi:hypothetical protein
MRPLLLFGALAALIAGTPAVRLLPDPPPVVAIAEPHADRPHADRPHADRPHADRVVASRHSALYHRPRCRYARRIPAGALLEFESERAARESGRRACGLCRPD